MKKIEAVIRPDRLEEVKEALAKIEIQGITISQVMGCGRQKGQKEVYRGTEIEINVLPKVKIETVVEDSKTEAIIAAIVESARIDEIGDGKIFVSTIDEVVRIRTGERGTAAL